jgi:hypothetical protein
MVYKNKNNKFPIVYLKCPTYRLMKLEWKAGLRDIKVCKVYGLILCIVAVLSDHPGFFITN